MTGPGSNAAERAIRRPVVTRKNAVESRNQDAARLAARTWTVTATAQMAGLNVLTCLSAYLDALERRPPKTSAPGRSRPPPDNRTEPASATTTSPRTVTPTAGMPNQGTSEYLRLPMGFPHRSISIAQASSTADSGIP